MRAARPVGADQHVVGLRAQRRVLDDAVVGRLGAERRDHREHRHRQAGDGHRPRASGGERVLDAERDRRGRCSRVASAAIRDGFALTDERPRRIASSGFSRPARHAGSAVNTATSAATPSTPTPRRSALRPLACRSAEQARAALEQQRAERDPERRADDAGADREHEVLGDEQGGHATRREAGRLEQADVAPRGEHPAADRVRDHQAGGDQRQEARAAENDRQPSVAVVSPSPRASRRRRRARADTPAHLATNALLAARSAS